MAVDSTHRPPRTELVPPGGADLHERDMTATFAADVTLGDAQRRLSQIGQWLPVDGDPQASLGDLVSFNSTGPLRLGFGAWRDLLLGVQFTNGRQELITAGGRTVKNVAGYDLTKFMVGQRGVFGRIVTITARTYRRPAGSVLARHRPEYAILLKLLPTPLRPQWAVLTPDELLCGYLADETTLDWYEANVRASEPMTVYRRALDVDVEHRATLWKDATSENGFRASVPPARVRAFVRSAAIDRWCADVAFGVVVGPVASKDKIAAMCEAASGAGGTVTFSGRTGSPHHSVPLPSDVERRIIERLKDAFDPDNTLSPLPWQVR
jgi:hypothetical protein